jgi:hypothetical protein
LQVRLHWEIGTRQVQRVFPVRHVYPLIVFRDAGGQRKSRRPRSAGWV